MTVPCTEGPVPLVLNSCGWKLAWTSSWCTIHVLVHGSTCSPVGQWSRSFGMHVYVLLCRENHCYTVNTLLVAWLHMDLMIV